MSFFKKICVLMSVCLLFTSCSKTGNTAKEGGNVKTKNYFSGKTAEEIFVEGREISGAVTTFQCAAPYSDDINLNADSVMVYVINRQMLDMAFPSWIEREKYSIDMMIALNRDNADWTKEKPENMSAIQTKKDGSLFFHGSSNTGNYYMVPTEEWIEYIWDGLVKPCLDKYHPRMIALEEPEMWHDSGYSQGFKDEWEKYYGEEWSTPSKTPESLLKSERLKTYLFERIIEEISSRIKAHSPDTLVYIALHSTLNYNAWGITAGLNHYTALGCLDGVIGQTWSDTVSSQFTYEGKTTSSTFKMAYLEYASYLNSVKDIDFFALSDPKADNPSLDWDTYEKVYRDTVVASILQPSINRFELFPWPERSYSPAPSWYKTYQLNVFKALKEMSGNEMKLGGGTFGVAVALSDSISWQFGISRWTPATATSIYGMSMPLIQKGIPVSFKSIEHMTSDSALDGVKLLILSYDCQKPMKEQYNENIANWVKKGGHVLYIGGYDAFSFAQGEIGRASCRERV